RHLHRIHSRSGHNPASPFWRNAANALYKRKRHNGGPPATCDGRDGRSISSTVREPPRLHAAILQAASGHGPSLLFQAEGAGWPVASSVEFGNPAPALGRRTDRWPVLYKPEDSALQVGRDRRRLQERGRTLAE